MINDIANIRPGDDGKSVVILDQTLLPGETKYLTVRTREEMFDAIYMLRVRGAPAIGIFAAYALYVLAANSGATESKQLVDEIRQNSSYLNSSRPTAVNLHKQLTRMTDMAGKLQSDGASVTQITDAMRAEAVDIHNEDIEMCRAISRHGLALIQKNMKSKSIDSFGIMTQCNAGPLATSKYGTGLGPIILGHEQGIRLHAYICETRPLLQGARLTAYELDKLGIDSTLICDNMASIVMSEGKVNAVFTGADRIAANGDVANKVGTSALAILAKHYGIPFYVFAPSTTVDPDCRTGDDIEIELRDDNEIKDLFFNKPIAPAGVKCYNPAFDITPGNLITAIITEDGIL